jgi:DNA-binding IclR family transcriptional regulator
MFTLGTAQIDRRTQMPKYEVEILETLIHTVVLEANDQDEAYRLGNEIVENADPDSYTTVSDGCYETNVKEIE